MCRNIKTLFNFDPPVTEDEVHAASLQFVRKITGFSKPSKANEEAFCGRDSRNSRHLQSAAALPGNHRTAQEPRRGSRQSQSPFRGKIWHVIFLTISLAVKRHEMLRMTVS
jgi:hypothetical protein